MSKLFPLSPTADPLCNFRRNAVVQAMASLLDRPIPEVARSFYGNEGATAVLKAATTSASTAGWGSALAGQRVETFLGALRPRSAFAQLRDRGLKVDMAGVGTVSLPRLATSYPLPAWVAEGEPIPAQRGDFGSVILTPGKMAALAGLTQELRDLSAESAEAIITELMEDAAARQLDASVFSATAASAVRPAGILNGVTAIPATAGGGVHAMATDVGNLVGAIHAAGGGMNVVLVAAPQQAVAISLLGGSGFSLPVITAPSLADGTIIAVESGAFASGFSNAPRVDVARDAVVHWDDSPTAISTAGAPNTVAAPARSGFQQAVYTLRLVLRGAWAIRGPGLVQHVTGATF